MASHIMKTFNKSVAEKNTFVNFITDLSASRRSFHIQ